MVAVVNDEGGATMREQAAAAKDQRESDAAAHPSVKAVLERFPGARIVDVRDPRAIAAAEMAAADAAPKTNTCPMPSPCSTIPNRISTASISDAFEEDFRCAT